MAHHQQGHQSSNLSPAMVQNCLKGVDYPATKEEILEHARKQKAGKEVISFLENLSENQYDSPVGIMKDFGETRDETRH